MKNDFVSKWIKSVCSFFGRIYLELYVYNKNDLINCRKNSTIIATRYGGVNIARIKLYSSNIRDD